MRWSSTPAEARHHHAVIKMVSLQKINAITRLDGAVFVGLVVSGRSKVSPSGSDYAGSYDIDTADGMHYVIDVQDIETASDVDGQYRAEFVERGIINDADR